MAEQANKFQVSNFGKTAQNLAKNPLGIIALFIVLLYAIAGIVLGISVSTLQSNERWPLIWFIVIFPILVLIVFTWLVAKHHKKLYAPSDFRDDESFLQAATPEAQRQRLENEILDYLEITEDVKKLPDGQQTLNVPDTEAEMVEKEDLKNRIKIYREDTILAEDLALRQVAYDLGGPVSRQVLLSGKSARVAVDGFYPYSQPKTAIEIKYLTQHAIHGGGLHGFIEQVDELADAIATISKETDPIAIIVVAVIEDMTAELEYKVRNQFREMNLKRQLSLSFETYDFDKLKERWLGDED